MNAKATVCPPRNLLSDFGLGKLDDRAAETLSEHLETCDDCRRQVDRMEGDSFVQRMREAVGPPSPGNPPSPASPQSPSPAESVSNAASSAEIPTTGDAGPAPPSAGDQHAESVSLPPGLADSADFEVIKVLGQGGMGVVYLARNRAMDRLEVLKVVNKSLLDRPGSLERFQQEIRAAARLLHPNIVAAHSVPRLGDLLVFAMEYVDGQDLSQVVKRRGPLPVTNATFYTHQVALGLQHAHEKGMVHRDIKPGNLMLAIEGKKHVVKILDFGLAKATSEKAAEVGLTQSGQILGTPAYIAPEQTLDAHKADIRADIYSLGCTLYFLLAGHPPFQGASMYEILQAHHQTQAQPLNLVRSDVPAELAAVVSKMLAKNPAQRYQTPAEVAKALGPFFKAGAPTGAKADLPPPAAAPVQPAAPVPVAAAPKLVAPRPASTDPTALRQSSANPAPAHARKKTKPTRRRLGPALAIGLLLLGVLGAAAIIFKFKTSDGIVVVKVNVPGAEVLMDGSRMIVTWDDGGKRAEIRVPPGAHQIELKKDGFQAYGETVSISSGGEELVTARLDPLPGSPPPAASGKRELAGSPPPPAIAPFDAKQARAHQEAWANYLGVPVEQTNSIGMKLVLIPPGEFMMGSTSQDLEQRERIATEGGIKIKSCPEEMPQHRVTLTKPFLMGNTEVTIAQFRAFVDATHYATETEKLGGGKAFIGGKYAHGEHLTWRTPGHDVTGYSPVTQITWNDATAYCNWLSGLEGLTACYPADRRDGDGLLPIGNGYRLPTEAEWEYSCRAGTSTQFSFGDAPSDFEKFGWPWPLGHPRAVGLKLPNAFGLYDMLGNVEERCNDFFDPSYYATSPSTDPTGPVTGPRRVTRGGNMGNSPIMFCRSAARGGWIATLQGDQNVGFRVVRVKTETGPLYVPPPVATSASATAPASPDDSRPPHELLHAYRQRIKAAWPGREDRLRIDEQNHLKLDLSGCQEVHDLTALAGMRLQWLSLSNCKEVGDLTPLRGMPLAYLSLSGCRDVTSLEAVKGMPLVELHIFGVSDLRPLAGLPLRTLRVVDGGSGVTDVTPLSGVRLTSLSFFDCRLEDISPLKGMPLTELVLRNCLVRDLTPLKGMKLTRLDLTYEPVSDLTPLVGMPLTWLDLDGPPNSVQVQDLSPLRGLPLSTCRLCGCELVKDFTPVAGMSLTELHLPPTARNEDLLLFKDMALARLELANGVHVTDLAPTAKMPLEHLHVGGCERLSDLAPLAGKKLKYLYIYRTAVTDLTPLRGMALVEVRLTPSNISTGLDILRAMPSLRFIGIGESGAERFTAIEFWKRYDAGEFTSKQSAAAAVLAGPYKWPAGTPAPAIAPFDAKQARAHQEAWAKHLGVPVEQTNSIGMKLVLIPPGEFMMGSDKADTLAVERHGDGPGSRKAHITRSTPQHRVTISKPFGMAATEVTLGQFHRFVAATKYKTDAERDGKGGVYFTPPKKSATQSPEITWSNPGHEQTDECPVVQISWNDAAEFCNWLSRKEGLAPVYADDGTRNWRIVLGPGYRLPTDAEWEFACRAGTTTVYFWGDDDKDSGYYAWYVNNSGGKAQPVAVKLPNAFGLFDVQGNAMEWVQDWYDDGYFAYSPAIDPTGPTAGSSRVLRGSNWDTSTSLYRRSACRDPRSPSTRSNILGFRVAREAVAALGPANAALANSPTNCTATTAVNKSDDSRPPHELLHAYRERIKAAWPGREDRLRIDEQNHLVLDLDFCQEVHDLTPLRGMRLNWLSLLDCKDVADIAPLQGMPLAYLSLGGCRDLTSLEPLKGMPLEELRVVNARDLRPLAGLSLRRLRVYDSAVTDLSPLKGMPLEELQFWGCGALRDLTPLNGMKLTRFDFSYGAHISDLTLLTGMPLNALHLDGDSNQVQNLGPLRGLSLNRCFLRGCVQVTDFTPLAGMPLAELAPPTTVSNEDLRLFKDVRLTYLDLMNCSHVTNLEPTAKMPLERLHVGGCERLSDLAPLAGKKLKYLYIYRTAVTDLTPLRGMALVEVRLTPSNISTGLDILRAMPSLRFIGISETGAERFSTLEFWKRYDAGEFTSKQPAAVAVPAAPFKWPAGTPAPAIAPFDAKQARAHQEAWAKHLGVPVEQTNPIGMKLVLIPPGEFMMGSTPEQSALGRKIAEDAKLKPDDYAWTRLKEEGPQHRVAITKPCWLGMTEVTIGQFKNFVDATKYVTEGEQFGFGNSHRTKPDDKITPEQKKVTWRAPSYAVTDDSPVTEVTWNDAVQFCNWLSEQKKLKPCYRQDAKEGWFLLASGTGYRLPTEAEWEYACRAGTITQFSFGDDPAMLDSYGWFNKNNAGDNPRAVGMKAANAFDLFDMHGNAQEWCHDWYAGDSYSKSTPADPFGPSFGTHRVVRGGGWYPNAVDCRSAYRNNNVPVFRNRTCGFRVVRAAAAAPIAPSPATVAGPVANVTGQAQSKPDPIGAKLAKAKEAYEHKIQSLRDGVVKSLERREGSARANGDKKLVDQIKAEREAFEGSGKLPTLVPSGDYARQLAGTRTQLEAAYNTAIKAYTKAALDERSTAVESELAKFLKTPSP